MPGAGMKLALATRAFFYCEAGRRWMIAADPGLRAGPVFGTDAGGDYSFFKREGLRDWKCSAIFADVSNEVTAAAFFTCGLNEADCAGYDRI